jgi:hypothetical protein
MWGVDDRSRAHLRDAAGIVTGAFAAGERNAACRVAGPEALARGTRSLINGAEEGPVQRVKGALGSKEAEAAVFANDDARGSAANLNDVS